MLLRNRGLVKGINFKDYRYVGDPINAVRIFNTKEVDELIFCDIDATKEGRLPDLEHIQQIADECYMPFAVGGGIRSIDDITKILNAGAEKVAINTSCIEAPSLIKEASDTFGAQCIVASMDVKKTFLGGKKVFTHSGTKKTGVDPIEHAKHMGSLGAGELLITSIDHEGKMTGYDLELIKSISSQVSIPVIANGGAGTTDHLAQAVHNAGAQAVAAGSMFVFHGKRRAILINYPDEDVLAEVKL